MQWVKRVMKKTEVFLLISDFLKRELRRSTDIGALRSAPSGKFALLSFNRETEAQSLCAHKAMNFGKKFVSWLVYHTILYSKSMIINSGDSLVLLMELVCDFFGEEMLLVICFFVLWVGVVSSSSSSLSDIKSITTARFFSFGAGVVGLVSSNKAEYRVSNSARMLSLTWDNNLTVKAR